MKIKQHNNEKKIKILLQNASNTHTPTLIQFQSWITAALNALKIKNLAHISTHLSTVTSVSIRIVDEDESAQLNQTFRHKKGPTNVLSFPAETIPGFIQKSLGDLVICAPLVQHEAQEQDKPVLSHWAHLTIHGFLHLLGYDHETDAEAAIMEGLEVHILSELGIENPY